MASLGGARASHHFGAWLAELLGECEIRPGWSAFRCNCYPFSMSNANDAPPVAPRRSALLIIFLVVVIDLLGFAIVLPLLPRIAETYLVGHTNFVKGLTEGLLFSSFS